jgi:glycosyltransferase involved in cell wall biosynthesis
MTTSPLFSIVIATRDRADLFSQALKSVVDQTFDNTEIIVVNDGSSAESLLHYAPVMAAAEQRLGSRLRSHQLIRRPKGHGQSYSLNIGVESASGRYVCFLDDDDIWTDPDHLKRAAAILEMGFKAGEPIDLLMTNQEAFRGDERHLGPLWLRGLEEKLLKQGLHPSPLGTFEVDIPALLDCGGFCHLNCLVVRRDVWQQAGGMDENVRWECDHDVFLRLIDISQRMMHHPAVTSRHHIPDPRKGTSMTTSLGEVERRLWQVRVFDKVSLLQKHPDVRRYARKNKAYAMKRIVVELVSRDDWESGAAFSWQALGLMPTFKWAIYSVYCQTKRAISAIRR